VLPNSILCCAFDFRFLGVAGVFAVVAFFARGFLKGDVNEAHKQSATQHAVVEQTGGSTWPSRACLQIAG
jgi:hypothetical protein